MWPCVEILDRIEQISSSTFHSSQEKVISGAKIERGAENQNGKFMNSCCSELTGSAIKKLRLTAIWGQVMRLGPVKDGAWELRVTQKLRTYKTTF